MFGADPTQVEERLFFPYSRDASRGASLHRVTVAVRCWIKRSRIHMMSLHSATTEHPRHHEVTQQLTYQVQGCLAGISSVPCIVGGECNFDPDQLRECPAGWAVQRSALAAKYLSSLLGAVLHGT